MAAHPYDDGRTIGVSLDRYYGEETVLLELIGRFAVRQQARTARVGRAAFCCAGPVIAQRTTAQVARLRHARPA